MLSQVELYLFVPQFCFFLPSRAALQHPCCCLCGVRRLTLLQCWSTANEFLFLFFFTNSSFAAQSPHSTTCLADGHDPRGPTMAHRPQRCLAMTHGEDIAVPLAAARAILPCLSATRTASLCSSRQLTLCWCIFFFLFFFAHFLFCGPITTLPHPPC